MLAISQLTIEGFETPFFKTLDANNRWVILAKKIPWDSLANIYSNQLNNDSKGAHGINPGVAIGALIIKHLGDLSDRETINAIQENLYMQYFIGCSSFSNEAPFDASLFVDIRKRLGITQINEINERILQLNQVIQTAEGGTLSKPINDTTDEPPGQAPANNADELLLTGEQIEAIPRQGELIVDATACPQDISYPTDLNLLSDAREKSEELIDALCMGRKEIVKPRTYRETARKQYLRVAQKKNKTKKEIRAAIKKQLACLKRNLRNIHALIAQTGKISFNKKLYKYFLVIQTLYDQQREMHTKRIHSIDDRIVSIHQPHVRPKDSAVAIFFMRGLYFLIFSFINPWLSQTAGLLVTFKVLLSFYYSLFIIQDVHLFYTVVSYQRIQNASKAFGLFIPFQAAGYVLSFRVEMNIHSLKKGFHRIRLLFVFGNYCNFFHVY